MAHHKVLHLGLTPPSPAEGRVITHCPIIRIVPVPPHDPLTTAAFAMMENYSHLLFTSQPAVELFFTYLPTFGYSKEAVANKAFFAVGTKTASKIKSYLDADIAIAKEETAEGIVSLLEKTSLENAQLFWPHSSLSRPLITDWLVSKGVRHHAIALYHTFPITLSPLPDLNSYDEIVFTSPSTIDAFIKNYGSLPKNKLFTCIGPVTRAHLEKSK